LERLQSLVEENAGTGENPIQRIGLSATMRPLSEVASFLGGFQQEAASGKMRPRPVEIIDAGHQKELDLQIILSLPKLRELPEKTIWPSIYRKVVDLVLQHRTTLVFVNNRRLAERMTANLNKVAGKEISRTHHGSLAREIRLEVEKKLKSGELPCIVATSSLELGIDVGEIDLVIQIESPKEVAKGLQRVGRAGHVLDLPSKGRIIPKNRADLLETVALLHEIQAGRVEKAKAPMNCLDILAQQLVAVTATGEERVDRVYQIFRSAYNYHTLSCADLERVLAMLDGSFEAQEYLDLHPRLFWDRAKGIIKADPYGKRLVYTAGGTIPDRGYFRVCLAGSNLSLGELDEEFVYERRLNERFVLGTSVWKIEEIRQDRVLVSPAGKGEAYVPFWKAEQGGRSYELGKRIGAFLAVVEEKLESGEWRILIHTPFGAKIHTALGLLISVDWEKRLRKKFSTIAGDDGIMFSVPAASTDRGRLPAINWEAQVFSTEGVEERLAAVLCHTALFGSIFRHCAQRSLVMPRGGFGRKRLPLWLARIKAGNLLQTVAKYKDFPLIYETYRQIFQDYFDLEALREVLNGIRQGKIEIYRKNHQTPSPFATGHLFNFIANFMYENDTPKPPADHRQLFGLGQESLKTIVTPSGFRDLFKTDVIKEVDRKAQGIAVLKKKIDPDRVRFWLQRCGDLTESEIDEVFSGEHRAEVKRVFSAMREKGEAVAIQFCMSQDRTDGSENHLIVDRNELGIYLSALREMKIYESEKSTTQNVNLDHLSAHSPESAVKDTPCTTGEYARSDARRRIIQRFTRTHGPFTARKLAVRYGFTVAEVEAELAGFSSTGLVEVGEFTPDGEGEEWCDTEILREIHRRSLSQIRQEVKAQVKVREPWEYATFLARWQGVIGQRRGEEGVCATLSQFNGLWLPAALWEKNILPSRVKDYSPLLLDRLISSGQFTWQARGGGDGFRIMFKSLLPPEAGLSIDLSTEKTLSNNTLSQDSQGRGGFSADNFSRMSPQDREEVKAVSETGRAVLKLLRDNGAQTLPYILKVLGLPTPTLWQALEELMMAGLITNDSFGPIRFLLTTGPQHRMRAKGVLQPSVLGQMGRWSVLPLPVKKKVVIVSALLNRYGLVCREIAQAEGVSWREVYPLFDTLEQIGQVKRGYFIKGLSGIQYALSQALEKLRKADVGAMDQYWALHRRDPANPLNYIADWPEIPENKRLSGDYFVFAKGRLALAASGRKLKLQTLSAGTPGDSVEKWVETLITSLYAVYPDEKMVVSSFNGEAVSETEIKEVLRKIGFEEGYREMILWASSRTLTRTRSRA